MKNMFIIFLIFLTTVFANSHEKYIDLLPEEEKQEFLDQVARRIMENVESKEHTNKFSRELTDDQLKEHNEFVQSILKQESQMRRSKAEGENKEEDKTSGENLEVKPLQPEIPEHNNDMIDNIKRRSYDGTFKGSAGDNTKNDSTTGNLPMQKRSIKTDEILSIGATNSQKTEHVESTTHFQDLTIETSNYTQSKSYEHEVKPSTESPDEVLSKESDTDVSFENVVPLEKKTITTETIKTATNTTEKTDIMSTYTTYLTTTTKSEDITQKTPKQTKVPLHKVTDSNITYIIPEKKNISHVEPVKETINNSKTPESSESSESDEDYTPAVYGNEHESDNSTLTSSLSDEGTTPTSKPFTETYSITKSSSIPESSSIYESSSVSESISVSESSSVTESLPVSDSSPISESVTDSDFESDSVSEPVSKYFSTSEAIDTVESQSLEDTTTNTPLLYVATTKNFRAKLDTYTDQNIATTEKVQIETSATILETTTVPTTTTTLPIPALTPTNIDEQTTKKPRKVKSRLKKAKGNSTSLSKIASNALEKVKDKYSKKKKKLENDEEYQRFKEVQKQLHKNALEGNECKLPSCKGYRVFEVHWPVSAENQSPFLRESDPTVDQPFFVPIYNYSPNHVYYNPDNRLGPNAVEQNSIEIETGALRSGNNDESQVPERKEFFIDLDFDLMRKFDLYTDIHKFYKSEHPTTFAYKNKKKKMKRTNEEPSEETATEFVIHFPNSNEDKHPYNNMKGGMKNHIRIIRDVLFHNRQFFDSGNAKEKDFEKFLYGDKENKRKRKLRSHVDNKNYQNRDVDIDYYLGRTKQDYINTEEDNGYVPRSFNEVKSYFVNLFTGDNFNLFKIFNPNKAQAARQAARQAASHSNIIQDKVKKKRTHNRLYKKQKLNDSNPQFDTISTILSLTPANDLLMNLKKMQDMNLKIMRRNSESKFGTYMNVLRDMIDHDHKALKQYNWLATSVQIQSALAKLLELISVLRQSKPIHPSDVQILKYMVFLHNFASEIRKASSYGSQLRKQLLLPKPKKRRHKYIKEKGLINRVWLYLRTLLPDLTADDGLTALNQFMMDVEDALYDLHEALKNIAKITKFKNQHWYENLKDLYLTTEDKQVREVLLHISLARLVALVEYSCQNGLEDDFVEFMKKNKKIAKRTLEEMLFVIKIVDEINESTA